MANFLRLKESGSILGHGISNAVKERGSMANNANNSDKKKYFEMLERQLQERSLTRRTLAVELERLGVEKAATKRILKYVAIISANSAGIVSLTLPEAAGSVLMLCASN